MGTGPGPGPGRPVNGRDMLARLSEGFCPRGHTQLNERGSCRPCGDDAARIADRPWQQVVVRWRLEDEAGLGSPMMILTVLTTHSKRRYAWAPWLLNVVDNMSHLVEDDFRKAATEAW